MFSSSAYLSMFYILYLEINKVKGLFWTGSLSKSVKTCDERSTFAIPILFFLKFYFHDFSVKNYLILYAKQNKSGSEGSVSCQGSKMSNFCLEQGRGLRKRLWHSSTQTSPECAPLEYICPSNIRARPPQSHSLLQFSLALPSPIVNAPKTPDTH